jgi:hypothetical protein
MSGLGRWWWFVRGEGLAGTVVLLHLLDDEFRVGGVPLGQLLTVTMETDGVTGGDVGSGSREGISLVVIGAKLETIGAAEDAAFEGVVGVADFDQNDGGDGDDSYGGDSDADDLTFTRADALIAGVAASAGGSAADEQHEGEGDGCGHARAHTVSPRNRTAVINLGSPVSRLEIGRETIFGRDNRQWERPSEQETYNREIVSGGAG